MQNFYYFGLAKSLIRMYSNKDFREARKLPRTYSKVGSWWNSQHALWVNEATGGRAKSNEEMEQGGDMLGEAFHSDNGIYSLHFDWVQVITSVQR